MSLPERLAVGALALIGLSATALPALATQALEGAVLLDARASSGSDSIGADPEYASWSTFGPRTLSVRSEASSAAGGNSVESHGAISANWDSVDAGSVQMTNYGWTVDAQRPGLQLASLIAPGALLGTEADWTYSFISDSDGVFNLAYDLEGAVGSRNTGSWALVIGDGKSSSIVGVNDTFEASSSIVGTMKIDLFAGHFYRFSLVNSDEIVLDGANGPATVTEREDDLFRWSIGPSVSAVPEPSTWTLSIVGFGLVGAALRRRRTSRYVTG